MLRECLTNVKFVIFAYKLGWSSKLLKSEVFDSFEVHNTKAMSSFSYPFRMNYNVVIVYYNKLNPPYLVRINFDVTIFD